MTGRLKKYEDRKVVITYTEKIDANYLSVQIFYKLTKSAMTIPEIPENKLNSVINTIKNVNISDFIPFIN